jgi:hypothetical protein
VRDDKAPGKTPYDAEHAPDAKTPLETKEVENPQPPATLQNLSDKIAENMPQPEQALEEM